MKNQYFGDINDYRKYGLIRVLCGPGEIEATICWMLTEGDGRSDGKKLRYLYQQESYKRFDPPLFDFLRNAVVERRTRLVTILEGSKIIRPARFSSLMVPQGVDERIHWFKTVLDSASGSDLIFFDPDNGMEVKSVAVGQKKSPKYLYWHEMVQAYSRGHSLLIYQHFPREERESFMKRLAERFLTATGGRRMFVLKTGNVAFFLVPQTPALRHFEKRFPVLTSSWGTQFDLRTFVKNHR